MSTASERITLPPLHSLQLPTLNHNIYDRSRRPLFMHRGRTLSISSSNTSESETERTPSLSPPASPGRYSMNSSFATTAMPRTPSPPPVSQHQRRRVRSRADVGLQRQNRTFRLVLAPTGRADAFLFVPPPTHASGPPPSPGIPAISNFARQQHQANAAPNNTTSTTAPQPEQPMQQQGKQFQKALLLTGPMIARIRSPEGQAGLREQLARGARIYPYKIVYDMASMPGSRRGSAPASSSNPAGRV